MFGEGRRSKRNSISFLASNLKERDPEQFWPPEDSSVCVDANKEIGLSADISATNLKYVEATESISNRIDTWDKAETLACTFKILHD